MKGKRDLSFGGLVDKGSVSQKKHNWSSTSAASPAREKGQQKDNLFITHFQYAKRNRRGTRGLSFHRATHRKTREFLFFENPINKFAHHVPSFSRFRYFQDTSILWRNSLSTHPFFPFSENRTLPKGVPHRICNPQISECHLSCCSSSVALLSVFYAAFVQELPWTFFQGRFQSTCLHIAVTALLKIVLKALPSISAFESALTSLDSYFFINATPQISPIELATDKRMSKPQWHTGLVFSLFCPFLPQPLRSSLRRRLSSNGPSYTRIKCLKQDVCHRFL